MTTISILTAFASCLVGFAIIELVMWLLEAIFATVKYIVCWITSKPCNWKQSYFQIRVIFTWLLKWVSFAELTPKQAIKHQGDIVTYVRTLRTKHDNRKNNIKNRLKGRDKND